MIKKWVWMFVFISFFFAGVSESADRVTVIKKVNTDFSRYGVWADVYSVEELVLLSSETEKKLSKSIDNSLLLLFGEQVKSDVYHSLFSSPLVTESLKSLLKRGGLIYFGPTSSGTLIHLPEEMKDFFKEIGAHLIRSSNYRGETPEYYFTGIANPDLKHPFTSEPNNLSQTSSHWKGAKSVRYFVNLPPTCKPLIVDKDKKVPLMIIQEGILGKGKIINSYCYSITRAAEDPFIENIIHFLYGKKEKLSARQIAEQKLGVKIEKKNGKETKGKMKVIYPKKTTFLPVIDGKLDKIWKEAPWIEILEYKQGERPKKRTKAAVLYDKNYVYLFYDCKEPDLSGLKTIVQARDGEVWNDDCVEFFLADKKDIYHFVVNAAGIKYDAKNKNMFWNPKYNVATGRTPDGWTAEIAFPFEIFDITPEKNPICKAGFCREEQQLKELSSWLPSPRGFADPSSWGYLSFLPEKEFLSSLKDQEKRGKPLYEKGYLLWYDNPYRRKFADTLPEKREEVKNLKVLVAKNEKECSNILVTNFTDINLTFRIEPNLEGIRDLGGNRYPFGELITLKEAVPRLNPHKQRQMDPVVKLDEGNLVSIPPYETRQLWLDIKGNLQPGKYIFSLSFVPVDNLWEEKKVKIEVEVLPLTFPEEIPLLGYAFGPYSFSWAKGSINRESYFAICPEYHLTYLHLGFPLQALKKDKKGNIYVSKNKEDYLRKFPDGKGGYIIEEQLAKKYAKGWFYSYGIYLEFNRKLKSLGLPKDPKGKYSEVMLPESEWERLFKEWVSTWFKFLQKEGISFQDFYVPLLDEPQDFIADRLLKVAKILKGVNPLVRTTLDPATWTTLELVKKLDPVVDLWMPWERRLTSPSRPAREELDLYQKSGKPFATYLCSPHTQLLPLLSYYRFRGFRTWLMKANGICLWSFNSWKRNDWNEFDVSSKHGDCMIFYHGDEGPIPSIRAESFREAFEDYYLLFLAQKKLMEQPNTELSALISSEHLEELIKTEDPDRVLTWRDKVLRLLSK